MGKRKGHFILKISNQGVYYNAVDFVPWEMTNFPAKDDFSINRRYSIFWEAKQKSFDLKNGKLEVEVVDHHAENGEDIFISQKPKHPVTEIVFQRLNWEELEKVLTSYVKIKFSEITDFELSKPELEESEQVHAGPDKVAIPIKASPPVLKSVDFTVKHSLKDTKFKMGYVEVEKKIDGVHSKVKIILENPHIIPEYDYVKPYFSKALGKKKIEISGVVHMRPNGQIDVLAKSKEINLINEALVTNVKKLKLKESILHPNMHDVDKSLFTPDEFFDSDEDAILVNIPKRDDPDILKEILEVKDIRNKRQLIYLSGKLQNKNTRLKFTLSPDFGFLFHVEGEEMHHFIWELLDSHATYIWSIEKGGLSLDKKYKLLEQEINFIRDHGRMAFLRNVRESEFIFNKVNHKSGNSKFVDGFPRWKMKVNERLV